MKRLIGGVLTGLMLALSAGVATSQNLSEPRGTVVIGQVTCFRMRVPDRGQSVQERVDHIQDIAAKYLGGDPVHLTIRPVGAVRGLPGGRGISHRDSSPQSNRSRPAIMR